MTSTNCASLRRTCHASAVAILLGAARRRRAARRPRVRRKRSACPTFVDAGHHRERDAVRRRRRWVRGDNDDSWLRLGRAEPREETERAQVLDAGRPMDRPLRPRRRRRRRGRARRGRARKRRVAHRGARGRRDPARPRPARLPVRPRPEEGNLMPRGKADRRLLQANVVEQLLPGIGVRYELEADRRGHRCASSCTTRGAATCTCSTRGAASPAPRSRSPTRRHARWERCSPARTSSPRSSRTSKPSSATLLIDWVTLSAQSPGVGRSIAELEIRRRTKMTVAAILRGDGEPIVAPEPTEILQAGDRLVVVGRQEDLRHVRPPRGGLSGRRTRRARRRVPRRRCLRASRAAHRAAHDPVLHARRGSCSVRTRPASPRWTTRTTSSCSPRSGSSCCCSTSGSSSRSASCSRGGRRCWPIGAIYLLLNLGGGLAFGFALGWGTARGARDRGRGRHLVVGDRHQAAHRTAPARQPREPADPRHHRRRGRLPRPRTSRSCSPSSATRDGAAEAISQFARRVRVPARADASRARWGPRSVGKLVDSPDDELLTVVFRRPRGADRRRRRGAGRLRRDRRVHDRSRPRRDRLRSTASSGSCCRCATRSRRCSSSRSG